MCLEIVVNFPWELAMDDTMESNEVAKDNLPGSSFPLNSWTSDLKVANPSSICMFMFGGCGGLGFSMPWCDCVGFSFFQGSIVIFSSAI